MVKKKSAENYDGSPYVTTLLSSCLWTFYGVLDPDDGVLIVTVNAVGIVTQVIYLAILLFYYPKPKKVKYIGFVILDLAFFGVVMAITLLAFHGGAHRTFMGILCATFSVVMYAAPLTVVVPNAAGILLGGIQLLVYFIYDKKSSKSAQMAIEDSIDIVKEGIDVEKLGDVKLGVVDGAKTKSQSLRNPSLSRQYSFKQVVETRFTGTNGARTNPAHESDVENGGIQ
ncbi:hypothetical protein LguiB_021389 [Lonicera macranthoides]